MSLDEMRLVVQPGSGLVARYANVVLFLPEFAPEQADLVRRMLQCARDASTAAQPGRSLARLLAGLLVGPEGDAVPSFASLGAIGEDVAVMAYGNADVDSAGAVSSVHISGSEAAAWVDRIIGGGFTSLSLTAPGGRVPDEDAIYELDGGVIPAAGVLLTGTRLTASEVSPAMRRVEPPPSAEPIRSAPSPEPGDSPPVAEPPAFVSLWGPTDAEAAIGAMPLGETVTFEDVSDAEKREPLPVLAAPSQEVAPAPPAAPLPTERPASIVKGVLCKHGHFNHPRALYCAYDGSAMVDVTRIEVDGPRPSLGVLVFDDGSAYSLESPYVVGRRPHDHPALASGAAQPLVVDDPEDQVSRNHLYVDLVGWDVTITDMASRNGTYLSAPGHGEPVRLAPEQPRPLEPGMRVRIGGRSFVYESHHRR